jgi:hypothetical protein
MVMKRIIKGCCVILRVISMVLVWKYLAPVGPVLVGLHHGDVHLLVVQDHGLLPGLELRPILLVDARVHHCHLVVIV